MDAKQEILSDNGIDLISIANEIGWDAQDFISCNYKVLDIWAKKEAIEFTHWVSSHQWQYLFWGGTKGEGWYKGTEFNCPHKTDEELYELYIKSKEL